MAANENSDKPREFWAYVLMWMFLSSPFWCMFFSTRQTSHIVAPPIQIGQVNTLSLQEMWRTNVGRVGGYDSPPILYTPQGLIVGSYGEITLFKHHTGEAIWQTDVWGKGWRNKTGVDSVAADNDRVYVWNGFYLSAYEMDSGQEAWKTNEYGGRGWWGLYLRDGSLFLYYYAFTVPESLGIFYRFEFDPQTGDLLKKKELSIRPERPFLFYPLETIFFRYKRPHLLVTTWQNNKTLWEIELGDAESIKTPYVYNDEILLMSKGDYDYDLFANELHTGTSLWQKKGVVSNAVALNDVAYVVDDGLSIQGYNVQTGTSVGRLELIFPELEQAGSITLVSNPEDSVLYLHDSKSDEIIAFSAEKITTN